MLWVADTGPVLHLAESGAEGLLRLLGEVALPPGLRMIPLVEERRREADDWSGAGLIDQGEAQAIALARQLGADILLTDDASARLFATSLGLGVRGSLGVILWLAARRRLETREAAPQLDRLAATSLWLSPKVLAEAHAALAQIAAT